MACADLAVILLAAGEARRFGGGKLEAELDGKMLGLHVAGTLAAVGFGQLVAVCNANNAALNARMAAFGFDVVLNPDPARGQASSLALGLAAAKDGPCTAALIALADMPYVTADHLGRLVSAFEDSGMAVCSTNGTTRMPPAILPRALWAQAVKSEGDHGARSLLRHALCIEAEAGVLKDVDRPEDLIQASSS